MFCNEDYLVNKDQACDICAKNNYLLMFFFFLSFIPFTTVVSAVIIARYVYVPHILKASKEEDLSDDEEEEEILYENRYPIDKSLVAGEEQDTNNLTVSDNTPDGLVFMKYNKEEESFHWWGEKKGVNYKYLETVARKYVKIFRCSNYYIDREESLKNEIEKRKIEEEKEKMKDEDKKEDVDSDDELFVKLKPNEKVKPKKIEKIAAKQANKYKYCGKINDFEMLKKVVKPKKSSFLSFASWKNSKN